jgi:hypothetical protein
VRPQVEVHTLQVAHEVAVDRPQPPVTPLLPPVEALQEELVRGGVVGVAIAEDLGGGPVAPALTGASRPGRGGGPIDLEGTVALHRVEHLLDDLVVGEELGEVGRLQPDHLAGAEPLVLLPPEDAVQDIPGVVAIPPQPRIEVDLRVEALGDHQTVLSFPSPLADLHRIPLLGSSVIPIVLFSLRALGVTLLAGLARVAATRSSPGGVSPR